MVDLNVDDYVFPLSLLFGIFILLSALNDGHLSSFSRHKSLIFLGNISYAIYIFQEPVHLLCKGFLGKIGINNQAYKFYIFIPVLIFVSTIVYYKIEKPMRIIILNYNRMN